MSIQIPNLHTSNKTRANADATVFIDRRRDAAHAGEFSVRGGLSFNPVADLYPQVNPPMTIQVDLSDSARGVFVIKTVEQLDTMGKATPTVFATGRCDADVDDRRAKGCRYWLMMVDNRRPDGDEKTPDVISFLIYDRTGRRVAYGTGPVKEGDVGVSANGE